MFKIADHIEFDSKNRAECPSCQLVKGSEYKSRNLALIPGTDGAYKCHRGCTTEEIRAALGEKKHTDRIIPSALAKPPTKPKYRTPQQIKANNELLLNESLLAKEWLFNRGITEEAIEIHKLGIAKRKIDGVLFNCVTIPFEYRPGQYLQKYRVAPWLPQPHTWLQDQGLKSRVWFTHKPDNATETWLCEGEWDAIVMAQMMRLQNGGNITTTGAGNVPDREQLEQLVGTVTIWYDLDQPGHDGAHKMARALGDRALIATVPSPAEHKVGYDVSDAINDGKTFEDFLDAAQQAIPAIKRQEEKPNKLRDRLISTDELLARASDYTEWLVPDLLPLNELILLAASPRAGKSLLAMHLAYSVASGQNFLDRPVTQGNVIYVQCEDSETKTKQRAIAQGWGEGLPIYWLDKFKLSELSELIELCNELDPRLIVLDTLSRIRDDGNSESSAEMSRVLEPLQELARDMNCCILPIHHTGKIKIESADAVDVFETIRGSSAIRATCRGTLVLAADNQCYRLCAENGYTKQDLKVLLDVNNLTWRLLGNWNPNVNSDQKTQVLECLTKVGSASLEQIAKITNLPRNSLYVALSRLAQEGMITKTGSRKAVTYSRVVISNISNMLGNLLDEISDTQQGVEGLSNKNNFFYNEDSTTCLIRNNNENEASFTVSDERHILLDEERSQPQSLTQHEESHLTNLPNKDLTVRSEFKLGDMVKIRTGRYQSMTAPIVRVNDDGTYDVRHKRWQIDRTYRSEDLEVVDRE
jgi:AAA domain